MNDITHLEPGLGPIHMPATFLDVNRFQQLKAFADIMAESSLLPASVTENKDGRLPDAVVKANCFLIVNQAVNWSMDPFAVAQCCSVVHGRLMFEGKLIAAVLDAMLRIKLHHVFGKYDDKLNLVLVGEEASGDALGIRIGEFVDGEWKRYVDGSVGDWKTGGNGSPWKPATYRKMLVYRGTREWSRVFEPGVILGVLADDEVDAQPMRDVTPKNTAADVRERMRANNEAKGTGGFDHDRIKNQTNPGSDTRDRSADTVSSDGQTAEGGDNNPSSTQSRTGGSSKTGTARDAASSSSKDAASDDLPTDEDMEWLKNVTIMLWSATFPGKELKTLSDQRKAAAISYPPAGRHQVVLEKAMTVMDTCTDIVNVKIRAESGRKYLLNLVSLDEAALPRKDEVKA